MSLDEYTTLRPAHVHLLAVALAKRELPVIGVLEPIADFEELLTFAQAQPTPIEFARRTPAWRVESVAARVIEAIAIAVSLRDSDIAPTDAEWQSLSRILLEHAEYLYVYPDAATAREKLESGTALALAGSVCASVPQAELWRLAGFGRIAASLAEAAPAPTDFHLIQPLDVTFSLAKELSLPILESAIANYNTVLNRHLTLQNAFSLPLSDRGFFYQLNLDFPGMAPVKAAVLGDDILAAKSAYTAFRREFLNSQIERKATPLSERCDTYSTAKNYLECLLRLSIHPSPAITATTDIGIAVSMLPEFRGSEQLRILALRRYKWIADAFFYPDGFHRDRTFRAQVEAIADFARFLSVYGNPTERASYLATLLEKQVAVCIHLSQPDYSFPPLGPRLALNFDAVELCTLVDSSFQREDFPYPDTTSHALPETGCYVMRDSWKPEAQYLFFDAYPQGKSNSEDTSNLTLYAHGRHLTTGSVRVLDTIPSVPETLDTQWTTTSTFDWVEKWHILTASFGNLQAAPEAADVHHKRAIFYLKGEYFILHDLVLGEESQTLEQIFRLGSGTVHHIAAGAGHAWTQDARRSNLFISATDTTNLTVALNRDNVIYRIHRELPVVLNTLLFPMKPHVEERPTVSPISVSTDADVLATGFTVESNGVTDTFLISDDGFATMSTADIEFVGEYLFLRGLGITPLQSEGKYHPQFVMLNARFLKVGAKVLADLNEPRESYVRM